ncbi:hypothetical protein NPIL_655071, partial [Nephila pilipes]
RFKRRISENANSVKVLQTSPSLNLRNDEGQHLTKKQRSLRSRFSARVHEKYNGTKRFCLDYRNAKKVADSYPLPRKDGLLYEE